ncbi:MULTISPECIES: TrbC/VirB2 family protein [unclassified Wolbachia]|uniref:TrbC/VirB2 family protein n=1 Tax=Wolbachia endosymbiont of Sergentomyia squamirostris TaxID=3113640 RepID=A0AAT9GB62_9RICK|nr:MULTISPECIES: TrbC/VirB2 family protein [unclassified Wolbachia]MCX3064414.1 TrbC/VirB2 family protein [Wolbachia endosymbiont of Drosophila pseudotakahashii]UZE39065.1 TrbC/VirB2 family protein [Wolbachia endosymbiont of Drosophila pseudotakahashii]
MSSIIGFFGVFCVVLLSSFSGYAADPDMDDTTKVICNIIGYVWGIGGPLMTVVIIGAALLAIFGRMPWPALFALGVFCAVFFGAKTIITKIMPNVSDEAKTMLEKCGQK